MAKRQLTAAEAFDLRQALHVATLDALMASRRWAPGDLIFQGGTSLHLTHGSPRYSEDLDFLVNSSLKLDAISAAIQARLTGTAWLPPDTSLSVSKAKDGRNPHAFVVAIGGPDVIGAVRVKVELWQTNQKAMSALKAVVAPVRLARGPAAGMQTFVPTADLSEIHADKVFALAARPYLKPRDVFDLHWLAAHAGLRNCSTDDMRVRLATYPNEAPEAWLEKAYARRQELQSAIPAITRELKRWLPSSWPLDEASVKAMVDAALAALEQGIGLMREIAAERKDGHEHPSP
ncbi:nucleotidyl transferase AbiEii/AbiGii toxin family protein [Polaromonas sp.]|uniref:nucleotidyl transferase AbiEii/AbiGii toxin family protein n=1 Tax=Polaromonas sp. TaxID=1869339 RepID=UPI002FCB418C